MPDAVLDNWQPVWNAQVLIATPVCVNIELRPGAGDIHICLFYYDALAQGNAYKPTKEPINYREPGGDQTHDLQIEVTPPAATCPARALHALKLRKKNATPMTCPRLHWTTESGMHMCLFQHIHAYIHTYLLLLISMLWHRQAIFESKGDKFSSSAECRIRTQRVSETQFPADWMPADEPTELSRIKQKLEFDSPSLWSASIRLTWPHCR